MIPIDIRIACVSDSSDLSNSILLLLARYLASQSY
jgi:hypothetical protein